MNIKIGDKVKVSEIVTRTNKQTRKAEVVTTDGEPLKEDKSNAARIEHLVTIEEMSLRHNRVAGTDEKGATHVWDWKSAEKLTPEA